MKSQAGRKRINSRSVIIYLLILAILIIIIYGVPKVQKLFEPVETVEYGTLMDTDDVNFYLIRDEKVYVAGMEGSFEPAVKDGTMVPKHRKIGRLSSERGEESGGEKQTSSTKQILERLGGSVVETTDCIAGNQGVVSYCCDGYEKLMSPDNLEGITLDKVEDIDGKTVTLDGSSVEKGEPIFKVSDSSLWYMACWVNKKTASKYQVGYRLYVDMAGGDSHAEEQLKVKLLSVEKDGEKYRMLMSCDMGYSGFAEKRVVAGKLEASEYFGLIVDSECLAVKDGQDGVYVRTKTGNYRFIPVQILVNTGIQAVLSADTYVNEDGETVNTIKVYDTISKRPDRAVRKEVD